MTLEELLFLIEVVFSPTSTDLEFAIQKNYSTTVSYIYEQGQVSIDTIAELAVRFDRPQPLYQILKKFSVVVRGLSLWCSRNGYLDLLKLVQIDDAEKCIMWAAFNGHLEVVKYLYQEEYRNIIEKYADLQGHRHILQFLGITRPPSRFVTSSSDQEFLRVCDTDQLDQLTRLIELPDFSVTVLTEALVKTVKHNKIKNFRLLLEHSHINPDATLEAVYDIIIATEAVSFLIAISGYSEYPRTIDFLNQVVAAGKEQIVIFLLRHIDYTALQRHEVRETALFYGHRKIAQLLN